MLQYCSLDEFNLKDVWLTIGTFDGVHLGHQTIIQKLVSSARSAQRPAVVLTFHPHPVVVLRHPDEAYYLTSPEERTSLIADLGVEALFFMPCTREVANISARDFMTDLNKQMTINHLLVGSDFALGRDREGDASYLRMLGAELGYSFDVCSITQDVGKKVSSSLVRSALSKGEVEQARQLLGRPYQVSGKVVHGDGRGRLIGIPTANLEIWEKKMIPKTGVYATQACVDSHQWPSVTNIGFRPTFENQLGIPQVESHILDFNQDLYGKTISLSFISRLRDEQRFPDIKALIDQIDRDIIKTLLIVKK
jgi:riboflavin kinase/FMN adenylyltransferase